MIISVSQIKKYMKSPSQWAGEYILGIKDTFEGDYLQIGKALHKFLETKSIDESYKEIESVQDKEKAIETLDILFSNAIALNVPTDGESEKKVNFELFGYPMVGYIDLVMDDCVVDYKTVSKLSKPDDKPGMWQSENSQQEYKLQMYAYMKATGKNKAKVYEIMKKKYKTKDVFGQVIEFELTKEFEEEMEKYKKYCDQMFELLKKFSK